jgi:hypothetical protein
MHNVTIDDTDASIIYSGDWNTSADDTQNGLDYGGSHHVSNDPDATATWNFTGVAFYYYGPLWPYPVNTSINIDDNNVTHIVDLEDYAGAAASPTPTSSAESDQSSVLWGSGLMENGMHTVNVSMAPDGQYVIVDAFIYTVLDPGDLPSDSATTTASSTSTSSTSTPVVSSSPGSATASPAAGAASTTKSSSAVPVRLIVGPLVVGIFVLSAILIYWLRRRHNRRSATNAAVFQQKEAKYSGDTVEGSRPSTPVPPIPVVQPPTRHRNSACLLCGSRPKNGKSDFCGIPCQNAARNLAPMVLEVPQGHGTFTMVESKFQNSWRSGSTPCPRVKNVYRIIFDSASVEAYDNYLETHGNESFRYHGTERTCSLGFNGHTILCTSPTCNACSIIRTSFEVSLSKRGGAFGQGIYTSSASNKSASYSPSSKIMFLTKVVLGNVYTVNEFAEVKSCPSGYQSVVFNRLNGKLNETVVYTNDAIRPVFLIAFE